MDIAVYFEKIQLSNDMCIFKPISVVRGFYDKSSNLFQTDYGTVCELINGEDPDFEDYFYFPTTIEELTERFGESSEQSLLDNYFSICLDIYYLGFYDYKIGKMNVKQIALEDLENCFKENYLISAPETTKDSKEIDNLNNDTPTYAIDLDSLIELRNSKSLEEIQNILDMLIDITNKSTEKTDENSSEPENFYVNTETEEISLKELRQEVLKSIVAQDQAVEDITRVIYKNMTSDNYRNKSHILVTGPTGTGKTEIVSTISKIIDLPYFEADATAYTKEGYVGKSVYSMLEGLIEAADGDIEKAQNGILIIDEIDKKMSSRSDDVSGTAVLYSLLKIMDRGVIELGKGILKNTAMFDTSNLTIISMGAFEELHNKKINDNKHKIGFASNEITLPKNKIILTKNDLIKGGFPSQVMGRIGDITNTNFFSIKDLERLLTKSDISALKIQQQYFKDTFGVDLKYTDGYVTGIATKAIETGTNARELKPLVWESVKYAFDEIDSRKDAKVLKLTKETTKNNRKYIIE